MNMAGDTADVIRELRLRRDDAGGPVQGADAAYIDGIVMALLAAPSRSLVLLIHGFNNDYAAGRAAYQGFFDTQRTLAGLPRNRPLAGDRVFGEVFWPGDADWGLFSFAFYMQSIHRAEASAAALADALRRIAARMPSTLRVDVVAHSMGCRLTLELLKLLAGTVRIEVQRIVTMAAAVPLFMLEDPDQSQGLRRGYDRMMDPRQDKALSLYSPADVVLHYAFPPGQTLAGEGLFPTELGRDRWVSLNVMTNLTQEEVRGANHSDYWGWEPGAQKQLIGRDANGRVQSFLGLDRARPLAPAAYAPVSRRQTVSRRVGQAASEDLVSYWGGY